CIACKKCVDVCPTECLQMHPVEVTLRNWRWAKPLNVPAQHMGTGSNAVC
ncbi:MAG: 4Fe-4S binding protein, partial [Methylobacter sp.]